MEMRNVAFNSVSRNPISSGTTDEQYSSKLAEQESQLGKQAMIAMGKEKYELQVSESTLTKAIEKANKALEPVYRRFEYSIHEKTGEVLVKVIDQGNDQVIREIPNEKFLDLMAKLQELIGLNIDEKR
ncbi:flagellar protein FlaG [compost metagenome]